jgi:predicted nucleotidyltransferase
LEVFGSAATGSFDPARSDVDFIVDFDDEAAPPGLLLRYLALAERLEQVVGCRVDLMTNQSIRNPYFRQTVDDSREMIYEDRSRKKSA